MDLFDLSLEQQHKISVLEKQVQLYKEKVSNSKLLTSVQCADLKLQVNMQQVESGDLSGSAAKKLNADKHLVDQRNRQLETQVATMQRELENQQ